MSIRQVKEGLQTQGLDESVAYTLTTTPWGGTPTLPTFKVWSSINGGWTDVTATVATGSPSVVGDVITSPIIAGLTENVQYRAIFGWTYSGNILSAFVDILGEK